jgi:hypothetical protein
MWTHDLNLAISLSYLDVSTYCTSCSLLCELVTVHAWSDYFSNLIYISSTHMSKHPPTSWLHSTTKFFKKIAKGAPKDNFLQSKQLHLVQSDLNHIVGLSWRNPQFKLYTRHLSANPNIVSNHLEWTTFKFFRHAWWSCLVGFHYREGAPGVKKILWLRNHHFISGMQSFYYI